MWKWWHRGFLNYRCAGWQKTATRKLDVKNMSKIENKFIDYSRELPPLPDDLKKRERFLACHALKYGINDRAAKMYGFTKGRLSQAFSKQKFNLFFDFELYNKDGSERTFKQLQQIFKQFEYEIM